MCTTNNIYLVHTICMYAYRFFPWAFSTVLQLSPVPIVSSLKLNTKSSQYRRVSYLFCLRLSFYLTKAIFMIFSSSSCTVFKLSCRTIFKFSCTIFMLSIPYFICFLRYLLYLFKALLIYLDVPFLISPPFIQLFYVLSFARFQ